MEEAETVDAIGHPIIREAIRLTQVGVRNLEIASMADIPGNSDGSSGSFTTLPLKRYAFTRSFWFCT